MKVLLLGEFSGFFTNLKKGLDAIGVECILASNKDGWKKIQGSDIALYKKEHKNTFWSLYDTVIEPVISKKKLYGYDIVYAVNPTIYSKYINAIMFSAIKKHSAKFFTSIAGDCTSVYRSYKEGMLGYYIYDENPDLCQRYDEKSIKSKIFMKSEDYSLRISDGIIPVMYEYAVGVRNRKNCFNTIPLPFDSSSIEYKPNRIKNGKIVIAHGIIREECKGSSYIIDAMKIIKERYPNDVEIAIDGKMPLDDYLCWLDNANILIDQCKEHCYGMNALYAMSKGCIVLGGASRNSLKEYGLDSCPVVHIKPDVNYIVMQLEALIKRKDEFERLGYQSRKFVEEFHDCKKIAQQYVDAWTSIDEEKI